MGFWPRRARVAPTAEDSLGTGKWQVMPGGGVRALLPELGEGSYFSPVARYAISVAGDPTRRDISELQIAPTLNIGLADAWFVTLYPSNDLRINFGRPISGQSGRLFLPLDAAVGRALRDGLTIALEVSVPLIKDYPALQLQNPIDGDAEVLSGRGVVTPRRMRLSSGLANTPGVSLPGGSREGSNLRSRPLAEAHRGAQSPRGRRLRGKAASLLLLPRPDFRFADRDREIPSALYLSESPSPIANRLIGLAT